MSINTFIATTDHDLVRATFQEGDTWSVETLLVNKGITCLAGDPANPRVLYIGTKNQGIWRSDDAGFTWDAKGLDENPVKSIAVRRIFISTDG